MFLFQVDNTRDERLSWRQPLVQPSSRRLSLELSQLLSGLPLGENDAVVQSVGLALPELHGVGSDQVATPESSADGRELEYFRNASCFTAVSKTKANI